MLIFIGWTSTPIWAQSNFSVGLDSIANLTRDRNNDIIYKISYKSSLGTYRDSLKKHVYKVKIIVDSDKSTLASVDYKLDFPEKTFDKVNEVENFGYLTIKKDTVEDRTRLICLKVQIYKNDALLPDSLNWGRLFLSVKVNGVKPLDSFKSYNYLAYVGTNFDLVDGPRSKNLFFATNIFLTPLKKKSVGLYLSLFGNRTMTITDTTGNIIRVKSLVYHSDTTYKRFSEQTTLLRTQVSDNLGAYISPLIKLGSASSKENILQLYYTPSLEFVWRRTHVTSLFTNSTNLDSSIEIGKFQGRLDYENTSTAHFNEFVFNAGLIGFMVVHESKDISVRVHSSVGYSSTFSPLNYLKPRENEGASTTNTSYREQHDIFYTGRAWITEPMTGLTLQAEITNTLKNPRPYYGVTLSKAINFQGLGKIFQPIIAR